MGFFELVVIGVIALVVFGPEKLPKVVYDVSQLWRSLRRTATGLRQEFDQAMTAEFKTDRHNEEVLNSLEENNIAPSSTLEQAEQHLNDLPFDVSNQNKTTPKDD